MSLVHTGIADRRAYGLCTSRLFKHSLGSPLFGCTQQAQRSSQDRRALGPSRNLGLEGRGWRVGRMLQWEWRGVPGELSPLQGCLTHKKPPTPL